MKKILIAILFYNSFFIFSQNKIKIVYDVAFVGEFLTPDPNSKVDISSYTNGIEDKLNTLKFELLINDCTSLFKSISALPGENETSAEKLARILSGDKVQYFRDFKNQKLFQNTDAGGTNFNVILNYNSVEWKLENETKQINNYLCYKATWKKGKVNVTAWYCPEIPYPSGPIEYGNLPGLIIELQRNKLYYTVSKIIFDCKDFEKINLPEAKYISENEFNMILQKIMNNLGNQ
jgi:GLPGLI family protein